MDRAAPPHRSRLTHAASTRSTRDGSAYARSAAAIAPGGRSRPRSSPSSQRRTSGGSRPGTGTARRSAASGSGFVEPSRMQMIAGFGPGTPESTCTGTSTGGVRIPPSAMPSASRRTAGGAPSVSSSRGARVGRPTRPDPGLERRASAALATTCIGPSLIGAPQSTASAVAPMRCASACAVPATSQRRRYVGVRLADRGGREDPGHVALGLEVEDRDVGVGAEDRRGAADAAREVSGLARARRAAGSSHRGCARRSRRRRG